MRARLSRLAVIAAVCAGATAVPAQERGPSPTTPADLQAAIDRLGNLEYEIRSSAARVVRRAPAAQAVPALLKAAAEHTDGYVRFRALVLLAGFGDPRTRGAMDQAAVDPNDRLREVAYSFFEQQPDPARATSLLRALDRELSEFVRPRLIRALAAHGTVPAVADRLRAEAMQGEDFFRSAVIEALGDYKAAYALTQLTTIANLEGPLQDDAALAIGKIGDKRSLPTLVALQKTAPRETQPAIAAGICLLGINCNAHLTYLADTLRFAEKTPGFQELLRATSGCLAAVSVAATREEPLAPLLQVGIQSRDPARAPLALSLATVAIRNSGLMLRYLESSPVRAGAVDLLRDGFDMLEEDFGEEQFFVAARRLYWSAPDGSPGRQLGELLIRTLEF